MTRVCSDCDRPARSGGKQCSRCYMRRYRSKETNRQRCAKQNRQWRKRNPQKVKQHDSVYKREWRRRTHFTVPPEVHELRRAIKRLEGALAHADKHS